MGCVKSLFEVIWSTGSKDTVRFVSAGIFGFWMFEYRNEYRTEYLTAANVPRGDYRNNF